MVDQHMTSARIARYGSFSLFSGRSPLPADPEQALAEAERLIESSPKEAWSFLRKLGRQRPEPFALNRPLASR